MKTLLLILFALLCAFGAHSQSEETYEVACVGFYNLENLFDTLDTDNKRDEEFTPEGRNGWNSQRYFHKMDRMSKVIADLGTEISPDGMAILGVAEVENIGPLQDLVTHDNLKERGYVPLLIEGPDKRGIDVGLIYQPKYFSVTSYKSYSLRSIDTTFYTRDQLLVSGMLLDEPVHIVVAHWPSRSGGEKRSEPRRIKAAKLGKMIVDSLMRVDPDAKILYMGDLNDDPNNRSCKVIMGGVAKKEMVRKGKLYNPMYDLYNKGVGSLAWRDTWNLFDQIMMTPGLLDPSRETWTHYTTKVYNKPFMTQASGNFKGYPFRTFAGGAWTGGYSDHFPVYVVLTRKSK